MKKIIEDNYKSTVQRGLITPSTTKTEFIDKIFEEAGEVELFYTENKGEIDWSEVADVVLVCLNFAHHYKIDIENELRKKIKKNFNR